MNQGVIRVEHLLTWWQSLCEPEDMLGEPG